MKKATAHESRDQANGYEVRAAASVEIVAGMDTKEKNGAETELLIVSLKLD